MGAPKVQSSMSRTLQLLVVVGDHGTMADVRGCPPPWSGGAAALGWDADAVLVIPSNAVPWVRLDPAPVTSPLPDRRC